MLVYVGVSVNVDVNVARKKILTQVKTIAHRELTQSGERGRASAPLCKFFKNLRIALFLFRNVQNTHGKSFA